MLPNSSFSKSRGVLLYHGPVVTRAHIGRTTLPSFNMVEPDAGAKLPQASPEECNCWMLRRWLQILCALTLSCHLYFFLSIIRKGLTVKSVKPTFIDQLERITQIPTLAKVREKGNYLTKYRVI